MSLNNISSVDGYLEDIGADATAVSEAWVKPETANNVISVKNISVDMELRNIGTASVADTLTTSDEVQDGDTIIFQKEDGTIHQIEAVNVTSVSTGLMNLVPEMTSNTEPSGEAFGSLINPYYVFDEKIDNSFYVTGAGTRTLGYRFPSPKVIQSIAFRGTGYDSFKLEASNDGINYDTLILEHVGNLTTLTQLSLDFINTNAYTEYRFMIIGSVYGFSIYEVELFGEETTYSLDTTEVTQGEIPSKAYLEKATVSYNDIEAQKKSTIFGQGEGDTLLCRKFFEEVVFPTPVSEIVTGVGMWTDGNKITRITQNFFLQKT